MHDPRVGRFFAIDPLTKKYPHYAPYSFSGNEVINSRELEGLEPASCIGAMKVMETKKYLSAKYSPEKAREMVDGYETNALLGVGGALTAGAGPAIYSSIGSGYTAYTNWFVGTSLSSYLSTSSGAAIFESLESMYTMKGVFQASTTSRVVNSSTNFLGQIATTDFKDINYAQPLAAFIIGNNFIENVAESLFKIDSNAKFEINNTKDFSKSFQSNLFGNLLGNKFEGVTKLINDFSAALKVPMDMLGGTGIEVLESKFSDEVAEPIHNLVLPKDNTKSEQKVNLNNNKFKG